MMRWAQSRLFLSAVLVACVCVFSPVAFAADPAVKVKDVRLWAGPDATRVVLDLSGPARHTLSTLQNPDRIVVDIASARLDNSDLALPPGQGFVKQLRAGTQGEDLRLVVDLSGPATPRSFTVNPQGNLGHRLVLDLAGTAPVSAAPAKAAAPVVTKSAQGIDERDIVVAIDAGHGGVDPGSIGKRGTYEKNVTLAIARRLKERIDREPGMRAVLTRDTDQFVEHRERIARARRQQADMFVSVHADSYHDRSVAGSSVYVLSARGASDESARWLADRENAADLVGGVSLDDKDKVLASVLLDLSQGASMSASINAADKVMHELYLIGNVTNRGVKHAGFLVLKSPDIPSILVETAFISNPTEEARLLDPRHQQRLAEAIHSGVRTYFYNNPPPGTRMARLRQQGGASRVASAGDSAAPESTAGSLP